MIGHLDVGLMNVREGVLGSELVCWTVGDTADGCESGSVGGCTLVWVCLLVISPLEVELLDVQDDVLELKIVGW